MRRTYARSAWLVPCVALAAYANALGNGFAYDDHRIVAGNPVVTEARWDEALFGPYWRWSGEGSGLYRPVTLATLALEWRAFDGAASGFHGVNVALHALASLAVLELLAALVGPAGATAGALWFAIHPVHVEAVANVVGVSELVSTLAALSACLVWARTRAGPPGRRAAGLAAIALLYGLGLGAKEIAVSLPGLLLLMELARGGEPLRARVAGVLPVLLTLSAVLGSYLVLRVSVLGTVTGEVVAPALRGLTTGERVMTSLSLWPEYLRLMAFPASLSADYSPGVLEVARSLTPPVILGAALLVTWAAAAALLLAGRAPALGLGLAWFLVAVLPVSNLFFATGVLLAERNLYLPSVGAALAVGGAVRWFVASPRPERTRRLAGALAALAGVALFVRTVTRNPAWWSTFTVMSTLTEEHPESYVALQHVGAGLARVGDAEGAARAFEAGLELVPRSYALMVEAGGFYARARNERRAEELLRHAIAEAPGQPTAYRLLAEQMIRLGRAREGHRIALEGLARAGPDRELWALVSEAYIAKGDLEASVRARRAALTQDPGSVHDWDRLAELLDALGRDSEASAARARAGGGA
ncbi:MAG TPA: hypothetical protein VK849_14105 [Longimicrobiales bacterium]|nr:hypothetical protein [Longimicrobiales bacterium]